MSRRSASSSGASEREVIDEICRVVIAKATTGERRFVARAARIDSTVVEADVRYPTDSAWPPTRPRRWRARPAGRRWRRGRAARPRTARGRSGGALRKLNRTLGGAHRPGQADRAAADRRGRRAGRALGPRGAPACRAPARSGPRSRRPAQAGRREAPGAARRARRHGRPPDPPAAGRARRSPTGWSR